MMGDWFWLNIPIGTPTLPGPTGIPLRFAW